MYYLTWFQFVFPLYMTVDDIPLLNFFTYYWHTHLHQSQPYSCPGYPPAYVLDLDYCDNKKVILWLKDANVPIYSLDTSFDYTGPCLPLPPLHSPSPAGL